MKITFFGAVQEVTGSRYLIEHEDTKILVDCGLFQGGRELRMRNWQPFPVDPGSIDAIVLTHAHVDHTGYIPALVKNGFRGKIYCSKGTYELCSILLIDCANIFEGDARRALEQGRADELQATALYTMVDAERALTLFQVIDYDSTFNIGKYLNITLIRSGHIIGSSFVVINDGKKTLTFSGDLGRPDELVMKAPEHLKKTDYLIMESTYGDRLHEAEDPVKVLGRLVNKTAAKGGKLIIPAFAVARTQMIFYCLYQLKQQNAIPNIPIFLDSPMAIKVTNLYCNFLDEHKLPDGICNNIFDIATFTATVEESKLIDRIKGPAIIIGGSGMADGGRVLHHFQHFISDPKNTIAFVGYQGEGTHGRTISSGEKEVELYGKVYKVRAKITTVGNLSAHADYNEILEWLSYFEGAPKKVFMTHGQIEAAQSLKNKIEERFGWSVVVPKYAESFDLD